MTEFVCFEAVEDIDNVTLENESCEGESISDIDVDFIDDPEYNESVQNYYVFESVSGQYDDGIGNSFAGFDFSQEPSSYCSDDDICNEVTEFKGSKKRLKSLIKL